MTEKLRPILSAIALILALGFWVTYCHDPQVRAGQRLRDSTTVVDAHKQATDRRVQMLAAESLELGGKLRRFARNDSVARGEIARLKSRREYTPHLADSANYDLQLVVRDSIIDAQDSVIASQDSQLTIWKALAIERGELLTQALGERDSYRRIAIAWQRKAGKHFGCAGGPAVVASPDGHVQAGVGIACGIRF